jgi:hypothetical protein
MNESVLAGLSTFSRSTLEDAKSMAFLNRFDTKYVLRTGDVPDFLDHIRENYSVLQIKDIVGQSYQTIYFDTPDLLCFNLHHNKRARRFKFRTRQYLSSGEIFNEIKQKQNTGKTIKFRQFRNRPDLKNADTPPLPTLDNLADFDTGFASLLRNNGYFFDGLFPSLSVYFTRLTFLNKHFPERMTLDLGLRYGYEGTKISLHDNAIIELKRERGPEKTVSQNYFRKIRKNPNGFSKYAIGISLTHENAKKNRFLPRIRKLTFERSAA